jgi:hypothetical protein
MHKIIKLPPVSYNHVVLQTKCQRSSENLLSAKMGCGGAGLCADPSARECNTARVLRKKRGFGQPIMRESVSWFDLLATEAEKLIDGVVCMALGHFLQMNRRNS